MNARTSTFDQSAPDRRAIPIATRLGILVSLSLFALSLALAGLNILLFFVSLVCGEIVWWMCWQNGRYHERTRSGLLFANTLIVIMLSVAVIIFSMKSLWIPAGLISLLAVQRLLLGFEREDRICCLITVFLAFLINIAISAAISMFALEKPELFGADFQWFAIALLVDFALSYFGAVIVERCFRYSLVHPAVMRILAMITGMIIGYAAMLAATVGDSMILGGYLGLKAILCVYLGFAHYTVREESYYAHVKSSRQS